MPLNKRLDRIARTLRITGRRLAQRETGWVLLHGHDRRQRPVMHVSDEEVAELVRQERLSLQDEGFYVLAGVRPAPAAPDRLPIALLATRPMRAGAGFLGLVRRARAGRGPLGLREVAAGLRLASDAEQSRRGQGGTMNWDGVPADKQKRRGKDGGLVAPARAAQRRLGLLKLAIGARAFSLCWSACVEGVSLDGLRQRFELSRLALPRALSGALRDLAEAYDRS